jgi:hypothetical protein
MKAGCQERRGAMPTAMRSALPQILGWCAVIISLTFTCMWAFWGIIENFHEGWYLPSLSRNLAMMIGQYLMPMLIFIALSLLSLFLPRIGAAAHILLGIYLAFFFFRGMPAALLFIGLPLGLLGALYGFGRPEPRRLATALMIGLPALTVIGFGIEPVWRVSGRRNDGNFGARTVEGNGVRLVWAPEGPGWPRSGVTWEEARRRCQYLIADGSRLADTPQDIWRLPTVEEAVRSMARHGQNCGGTWDAARRQASYRVLPDKETPLWNIHSMVIYWWTDTEVDAKQAYIIVYNGSVWPRDKRIRPGYLGFRAVKAI